MKYNSVQKLLSLTLCFVLIAAMALLTTGCGKAAPTGEIRDFTFKVVDLDGTETSFNISTDASTVGQALQEEGLIEGEEGDYGLYVTVVNGITADYDTDGTYWAFYIDGEYAMTGVDKTDVTAGAEYSFVKTKG